MLYNQILDESKRLDSQIKHIQALLQNTPPGNIFIVHDSNRIKWFHSHKGKNTYLPKSKREIAEQLSHKKYLNHLLYESIQEKHALDQYLKYHISEVPKSEKMITDSPEYHKLLAPFFQPLSEELNNWMYSSYPHNPHYPEQLNHPAVSGNIVRSKSEAMIDMVLYSNHIPFRYECALDLGESTIYPDFTVRHPKTGQVYYWEHFGIMDNPEYSSKAISKLRLYVAHKIIPSHQLITTYETKDTPLSVNEIRHVVQQYFQ